MALLSKDFFLYHQSIAAIISNPAEKDIVATSELIDERAYILAANTGLPLLWAKVVLKFQAMSTPASISIKDWENVQDAFRQLARDNFGLLKLIISCGWTLHDIFGCNLQAPMSSIDEIGLLLLISQGYIPVGVNKRYIRIVKDKEIINRIKLNYQASGKLLTDLI